MLRASYKAARGYPLDEPAEIQWRLLRVQLAEKFRWSLEYIDELSLEDTEDILAVWSGRGMAQEFKNG